jgi:putative membrane protein
MHFVRGFAMGAGNIVPGVSGGTIALIFGIYERLIASVRAGSKALTLLARGDSAGFRRWMEAVEWSFLIPLGVGMLVAVVALASLLQTLLAEQPEHMAALFTGLVVGSVVVAWWLIRAPRLAHFLVIVGVGVAIFLLLGIRGGADEESVGQVVEPALWAFFIAGVISISAMILPGISGSFLLVIMGMYAPVLAAVTDRQLVELGVFMIGAVVGLAALSQVLHAALQRYHDMVLAALIGLMAGSVRVLWPWPGGVDSIELALPTGDPIDALASLGVAVAAFLVVFIVARYAQGLEAADEHADAEPGADDEPTEPAEAPVG